MIASAAPSATTLSYHLLLLLLLLQGDGCSIYENTKVQQVSEGGPPHTVTTGW